MFKRQVKIELEHHLSLFTSTGLHFGGWRKEECAESSFVFCFCLSAISGSCNCYIGMNFITRSWFMPERCVHIISNGQLYWLFPLISPVFLLTTKLRAHVHALCTSYTVQTDRREVNWGSVIKWSSRETYYIFTFCLNYIDYNIKI